MTVCCVFSLESPHRGDSNKYTIYHFQYKEKRITPNYPKSADFSKGLESEFEITVVNEPSVFESHFESHYVTSQFFSLLFYSA